MNFFWDLKEKQTKLRTPQSNAQIPEFGFTKHSYTIKMLNLLWTIKQTQTKSNKCKERRQSRQWFTFFFCQERRIFSWKLLYFVIVRSQHKEDFRHSTILKDNVCERVRFSLSTYHLVLKPYFHFPLGRLTWTKHLRPRALSRQPTLYIPYGIGDRKTTTDPQLSNSGYSSSDQLCMDGGCGAAEIWSSCRNFL